MDNEPFITFNQIPAPVLTVLTVSKEGEFVWHDDADKLLASMPPDANTAILKRLRRYDLMLGALYAISSMDPMHKRADDLGRAAMLAHEALKEIAS